MIQELRRAHAELLLRIMAANDDLPERLEREGLTLEWVRDQDVLYLTLGKPRPSQTESLQNRTYLRVDPETLKLNGVEFHHADAQAAKSPQIRRLLWLAARVTRTPLSHLPGHLEDVEAPADTHRLAQDLRELVAAR